MTVTQIHLGQSRVVWFFVLSCIYGGLPVARALISGLKAGLLFAVGWAAFFLLTAAAAWCLYASKRVGWHLSLAAVLVWLAGMIVVDWNVFTIVVTVGMLGVLFWLFRPAVTEHFHVRIEFL